MPKLRYLIPIAIFALLVLGASLRTSYAQIDVETCPTIIEDALNAVGDNCGGLDRNSACYGYTVVEATFTEALASDFFSRPADRSPISSLETISTTPLRTADNEWGIALLSVQANLPDTLPGRNVVFMLLGDTEIENAVDPENAYIPGGTAAVTTSMGVDLRHQPDLNADLVGSIPGGASAIADATTPDGQWLRLTYNEAFGWVPASMVTTSDDLTTLGVITPNTRTPMQAFYFRNNISGTECTQAPDSLLVQGPQNLTIDINIAGADIRMASTALFRIIPVDAALLQILRGLYGDDIQVGSLLQLIAIDGDIYINPDTSDEERVPPGFSTTRCLSLPEDLGLDGEINDGAVFEACPWSDLRPLTPEELEQLRGLDGFGEGALNYPLDIPNLPDVEPTPTNTFTRAPQVVVLPPATRTPSATPTPTFSPVPGQPTAVPPTDVPTNTLTATPTGTFFSLTPSNTPTATPTFTLTNTPTATPTFTPTHTFTPTPTHTPTTPSCGVTSPLLIDDGDVAGLRNAIIAANNPACGQIVIGLWEGGFYSVNSAFGALPTVSVMKRAGADDQEAAQQGNGANAFPVITGNIRIIGNFSTLERFGDSFEQFRLFEVAPGGRLEINRLTMTNGTSANGGAVYNNGTLVISGSRLESHSASGNGGAIANFGSLFMNFVTLNTNNAATGGAIYSGASATLDNVVVTENYASSTGGGVANNGGTMTITNTAVYNNSAGVFEITSPKRLNAGFSGVGGGVANSGTLTLLNTTLFDNSHGSGIGGNLYNGGSTNASFVTIAGGNAGAGGLNVFNGGTLNMESSIVAGLGFSGACSGSINASNSFTDDASCVGLTIPTFLGVSNTLNFSLGGYAPVLGLSGASAVIDALPDCTDLSGAAISTDQTGGPRPLDGNLDTTFSCDAGAYEYDPLDFY